MSEAITTVDRPPSPKKRLRILTARKTRPLFSCLSRSRRRGLKKKKEKRGYNGPWPMNKPQVRSEGKAPADKRSQDARLLDWIETTEQKKKEKLRHRGSLSRNDRQPVHGTGRWGWRLRQREKSEKEIKGIKRRRGRWADPSKRSSELGYSLLQGLDRLLHFLFIGMLFLPPHCKLHSPVRTGALPIHQLRALRRYRGW
jgi:hypothetical protein